MRPLIAASVLFAASGCANGLDAPVARFAGSFDGEELHIVMLEEGDDEDDVQALLQKVPVDPPDGIANNPDPGTVEIRNHGSSGAPTAGRLSTFGAQGGDCPGSANTPAFAFRLNIRNGTGSSFLASGQTPGTVVRIDSVDNPAAVFCHGLGRANITPAQGLKSTRLASYDYGDLPNNANSLNNNGTAPVGRRIIVTFGGAAVGAFNFTGSVFGNF